MEHVANTASTTFTTANPTPAFCSLPLLRRVWARHIPRAVRPLETTRPCHKTVLVDDIADRIASRAPKSKIRLTRKTGARSTFRASPAGGCVPRHHRPHHIGTSSHQYINLKHINHSHRDNSLPLSQHHPRLSTDHGVDTRLSTLSSLPHKCSVGCPPACYRAVAQPILPRPRVCEVSARRLRITHSAACLCQVSRRCRPAMISPHHHTTTPVAGTPRLGLPYLPSLWRAPCLALHPASTLRVPSASGTDKSLASKPFTVL